MPWKGGAVVQPWKCNDPAKEFRGFSWHSTEAKVRRNAKTILEEVAAARKKTAIDWALQREVADGIYLVWTKPSAYNAGYLWFFRQVGHLVSEAGSTLKWCVIGHAEGYQEDLWAQAKAHFNGVAAGPAASGPERPAAAASSQGQALSIQPLLGSGLLAGARRGLVMKALSGYDVLARSREDYVWAAAVQSTPRSKHFFGFSSTARPA